MLQLDRLTRGILADWEAAGEWPPRCESMADLEATVDDALARLRAEQKRNARGIDVARVWLDEALRSRRVEYLDRADVSAEDKLRAVQALHRVTKWTGLHRGVLAELRRWLGGDSGARRGPARLLELASGSGEFAFELWRCCADHEGGVEVVASDIVQAYVDAGARAAASRGVPVTFRKLNAFDLSAVLAEGRPFEVVYTALSAHHFTPGQLAMLIAQGRRVARRAFVLVDGQRGLATLAGAGLVGGVGMVLSRRHHILHDGLVSGTRFYAQAELEMIARCAAPDAAIRLRTLLPAYNILTVS